MREHEEQRFHGRQCSPGSVPIAGQMTKRRRARARILAGMVVRGASRVLLFCPLLLLGCFMGYDSRWGQQAKAQQHAAQRSTPHALRARAADSPPSASRTLSVRAYATPAYAAVVVDWQKQFRDTLQRANAVFEPEFGARFEASDLHVLRPTGSDADLDVLLGELRALEPAPDVDWVVVLAPAEPRFAESADDIGKAQPLSRHFGLRAMSDLHEYEAIRQGFSELSEVERERLYRVRKQHKLCTVFLHEIAHTLGVPHELLKGSLMNPRYAVEVEGFSRNASDIVRASLAQRRAPQSPVLEPAFAKTLDASLRATNSAWEPRTRDPILQHIAPLLPAAAPAPVPVAKSTPPATAVSGLSAEEQRRFAEARAELAAGHGVAAHTIALALFAAHSGLPEVQALRCESAMAVGGDFDAILAECPGQSPFGGK